MADAVRDRLEKLAQEARALGIAFVGPEATAANFLLVAADNLDAACKRIDAWDIETQEADGTHKLHGRRMAAKDRAAELLTPSSPERPDLAASYSCPGSIAARIERKREDIRGPLGVGTARELAALRADALSSAL